MKNLKVALCGIFACLSLVLSCAEQPVIYKQSKDLVSVGGHDFQHVYLVIYGENPHYIKEKLIASAGTLNSLETALNVKINNKDEIPYIENQDELYGTLLDLVTKNRRRVIVIAKGNTQTRSLLKLLADQAQQDDILSRTAKDAGIHKPFHSIILLNPAVTLDSRAQLIPSSYCDQVYHRIYNFHLKIDRAIYRLVYPEREDKIPSKGFYFIGTNIYCQAMTQGVLKTLTEEQLLSSLHLMPDAISRVDKYALHSTFNGVFSEDSHIKGAPPFIWIRKHYGTLLNESYQQKKEGNYTLKTVLARGRVYNTYYTSGTFHDAELARAFENKIKEELMMDRESVRFLELPTHVHKGVDTGKGPHDTRREYLMAQHAGRIAETRVRTFDLSSPQVNSGLCQKEKEYLNRRAVITKEALRTFLDAQALGKTPTIAVVASGGGSRAMFATLGALKGLIELGFFDAVTYLCGLSGSTWAIGTLYSLLSDYDQANIKDVINMAGANAAERARDFSFVNAFLVNKAERQVTPDLLARTPTFIKVKNLYGQPVTNTDYYGAEIARTLLGKGDKMFAKEYMPSYLSSMKNLLEESRYPLPIFTAGAVCNNVDPKAAWFEFTPYEAGAILGEREGALLRGAFVPIEFFGSKYERGLCSYVYPEQPLEFYLGVCGSALNLSMKNLAGYLPALLQSKLVNPSYRLGYAEIFNPVFELDDAPEKYKNAPNIGLFDAGLIFNLPFPVLNPLGELRQGRKADIVIFIDASDDNYSNTIVRENTALDPFNSWPDGSTLRRVKEYADKNGMPFPLIPGKGQPNAPGTDICQIYSAPKAPLVIYYPVAMSARIFDNPANIDLVKKDNGLQDMSERAIRSIQSRFSDCYATIHTNLEPDQARMLMAIMEYNVLYSRRALINAIGNKVVEHVLSPEKGATSRQISALLQALRNGNKAVDSLTLDECNTLIKELYPELRDSNGKLKERYPLLPVFTNEQEARDFLTEYAKGRMEHSAIF